MNEYMKEVKRLIDNIATIAFANALGEMPSTRHKEARAALLAHIQRGAVPEGWQVVPSADQLWNNDEVMALNAELGLTMDQLSRLASAITRIAHPADWRERFSQAVYDDLAAADNQDFPLEEYPARILKVLDAVIGREIKPAPAEVPMPEPDVTTLYSYTDSTGEPRNLAHTHDQMQTYGAACRAAGEAAGYARGREEAGMDAERYRWLRDVSVPPHNFYLSVPDEFAGVRYTPTEVDAAIDAAIDALRGEVK